MATSAISGATAASGVNGINLESFLKIVLAQLTYQDPLKPVDSAQFVSQLAQMTSLQQTQVMTDSVNQLLAVQGTATGIGMLGKTVEIANGGTDQNGNPTYSTYTVAAVTSPASGSPTLTVKDTTSGAYFTGVNFTDIHLVTN